MVGQHAVNFEFPSRRGIVSGSTRDPPAPCVRGVCYVASWVAPHVGLLLGEAFDLPALDSLLRPRRFARLLAYLDIGEVRILLKQYCWFTVL